jgi:MYXO-CTERM domain-containing protein
MLLRKLLVSVAAAGICQAAAAGNLVAGVNAVSMRPLPYTFAELYALTTDMHQATLAAMSTDYLREWKRAESLLSRPAVVAQQAVVHAIDARPEARPRRLPEGVLVQVDSVPEPTGWMTLLSGLLAVALIARRRAGAPPD